MWPKGNIERQPPQETEGGIIMSIEFNRRDFLKLVSATASAAAISGKMALWPSEAMARPIADPGYLSLDDSCYIIDPFFDFCPDLPTFRELFALEGITQEQIEEILNEEFWRFEHLLSDPDNWSVSEIEPWLDTKVEMHDMSPWKAMGYTQYGPGIRLYEHLGWNVSDDLGLSYVEGEMPGHDFVGVKVIGDLNDLNDGLAIHGLNLIISQG
jgi:hypothetical protein